MPASPISLAFIADAVGGDLHGDGSLRVNDVVHDSRDVRPSALFVAVRGFSVDGHVFVGDAVGRGAVAVLVEEPVDVDAPQILVEDTRAALAVAAAEVHGRPSSHLKVIGITGTNGKTTTTYMLESIARAAHVSFARLGTLGASINGTPVDVPHTTPEASDLQRLLASMVDAGVEIVAMEVSSHALVLHRADAITFEVAAFTNLSQDHLDFHGDMESYATAKRRLFDGRAEQAVVWTGDPVGADLATRIQGAVLVGFEETNTVFATEIAAGLDGSTFQLHLAHDEDQTTTETTLGIGGTHNIENALVAAACAEVVGIPPEAIFSGLADIIRIPGRLDLVDAGQPFVVLVDYAHSPGGVEAVVRDALRLCEGSVIVVIGSAGDRDALKRPLMGAAAALADVAVITSDNPRSEDPQDLVDAVVAGARAESAVVVVEVDRAKAIHLALDRARPGDAVLILGKGHEQGQDFGGNVVPFDDRQVAVDYLAVRWAS